MKKKKVLEGVVCWKIVARRSEDRRGRPYDEPRYISGFAHASGDKFTLFYKENHITKAPEGTLGIFAFDTREKALKYAQGAAGRFVKKAMGFGKREEMPQRIPFCPKIREFYDKGWVDQRVPSGTVLFDALTILL